MAAGRRLRCSDSYLHWAKVQLPNSSNTAWAFQIGSTVTVHSLVAAPCVVALGDPGDLVKDRRESAAVSFNSIWVILPCSICAWLFVGYLVLASCYSKHQAAPSARSDASLGGQAAENLHRLDALSTRLTLPPGHWSQWDADQVVEASDKLFTYFDKDRSGYLDVNEMVTIMAQLGIQNRHLVP